MDGAVDFSTLKLVDKPNQYLVCPAGECAGQAHAASPVYAVPAARLKAAWTAVVMRQPRVRVIGDEAGTGEMAVVQRSKLMRFPDTVTVAFVPLADDRSTLYIYSRSTYGHSDLGVNEKRIKAWLAELSAELGVPAG
jgi:uncharacterized protein (DUF1499 family)